MKIGFVRTIRSTSSERFLLQSDLGEEIAALDLHFLDNGSVFGTLILFDDKLSRSEIVEEILSQVDEVLLPMASLNEESLTFTVVAGKVIGDFVTDTPQDDS
ncbi:MAG: hypothetical protein KDA84_01780 [Planctomycetaceae bacterium]|nr:hypothetical protein [Planctomycetaceae bacterium]